MTMRRVLMTGQDKGGSGKSLVVRALAESVVTVRIIELEDEKRLIELEDRVDFFPVRADRSEIDRTSGAAARSEYDAVLDLMARKPAAGATAPGATHRRYRRQRVALVPARGRVPGGPLQRGSGWSSPC